MSLAVVIGFCMQHHIHGALAPEHFRAEGHRAPASAASSRPLSLRLSSSGSRAGGCRRTLRRCGGTPGGVDRELRAGGNCACVRTGAARRSGARDQGVRGGRLARRVEGALRARTTRSTTTERNIDVNTRTRGRIPLGLTMLIALASASDHPRRRRRAGRRRRTATGTGRTRDGYTHAPVGHTEARRVPPTRCAVYWADHVTWTRLAMSSASPPGAPDTGGNRSGGCSGTRPTWRRDQALLRRRSRTGADAAPPRAHPDRGRA